MALMGRALLLRARRLDSRFPTEAPGHPASLGCLREERVLCVPETLSTSCDQAIFVDQATDASLPSDAVVLKGDRFG